MTRNYYVQYGSHHCAPEGWRNFDASPTLYFERIPLIGKLYTKNESRFPKNVEYGNIVSGLPMERESCKAVYCSHVLEHLSLNEFRKALKNTNIILKRGGIFRLVLPDLEFSIQQYINNPSPTASIEFMQETYLGKEIREKGIKDLIYSFFGNSQHLWMWDFKALKHELETESFSDIRRAYIGDSEDSKFRDIENEDRWKDCLGIECKKK